MKKLFLLVLAFFCFCPFAGQAEEMAEAPGDDVWVLDNPIK
tara:strand:- start:256 stop:378 length:123 start_codon:yes stop_codon:yes gene_type:complete